LAGIPPAFILPLKGEEGRCRNEIVLNHCSMFRRIFEVFVALLAQYRPMIFNMKLKSRIK
jgi:hypothetical protein